MKYSLALFLLLALAGCNAESPFQPKSESTAATQTTSPGPDPAIGDPGPTTAAVRTTGYQAYKTDWQWDWRGPHFTIVFRIPHSTYNITRTSGISTSCCEGGINNWDSGRRDLGNGWDDYTLLIPKTLRSQYWYISDWDFSRYFWLWCTYTY